MEYKMIVRQTMFDFTIRKNGTLKLRSVKFLRDGIMKKKDNQLLVSEGGRVDFFVNGKTPVAHLTKKQFRFVTAAARFFGHLPDQKNLPIWLWADSLEVPHEFYLSHPGFGKRAYQAVC
jgi:hypothetical protein